MLYLGSRVSFPTRPVSMITVRKIGKHLGADISGVDLSQPLDDHTFARVANAFFDNEVVFLPNQKPTPEQQIGFTRRFGTLEEHVRKIK